MDETRETVADFIKRLGLRMECVRVDRNVNNLDWKDADHWRVTIKTAPETLGVNYQELSTPFSQGKAYKGAEPTLEMVLDCLANDASGYENAGTFESWCADYGYDPDSRKAFKVWETVQRQAAELKRFLGAEEYERLLWDTERL